MRTVEVNFNSNSRPRARTQQIGGNTANLSPGAGRPITRKLVEFEQLALYDTSISFGLFVLIDTLLASLGEIEHPDPEIQDFCRENISRMGGVEENSTSMYKSLFKMIHSTMWSGFSVTESLFKVEEGSLWIDDFVTYHPATIILRPNKKGRMVEGEQSIDMYKSGIWQATDEGDKLLPMWKTIRLSKSEMYGNHYGISALESAYKWTVLKDALLDMMAVALDRFGNPVVAITFPLHASNQVEVDPETGEERILTTQELLEKQILTNQFSGGGNVLLLPQLDKDMKPTAQVLTTGNNVGSTFLDAINNCDREVSKSLLIPYGLFSNDKISGDSSESQMEVFNRIVKAMYREFVQPILGQSFHRLIKLNFNRESAKIAPRMPLKQTYRAEDRTALLQIVVGLTNTGYFNPTDESDWSMVRQMVDASDRDMTKEDLEFIKAMIIAPREKTPSASGSSSNSSRAKGTAGTKGVPGGGAGRPVGSTAPKSS